MLKKIPVTSLRLGMHLHALEGPWIDHPFWKTKFTLGDSQDLLRLRECGLAECWIDVTKGLDVVTAHLASATPAAPVPATPSAATHERGAGPSTEASRSLEEELGAAAAICKRGRQAVTQMFNEARLGHTVDTERCRPLVDEITSSVMRNPGALVSLARLKTRDDYSYMHSVAVCALMVALARQMGMGDDASREAGFAGLLHDLGKAAMPLDVLNKPGPLTEEEFALIRTHPERGYEMLAEGQGVNDRVMDVCLHHHEKRDGSGYPHKLSGDAITVMSRMGAVCDVYDAITSNRPYKAGWDPAESVARMAAWQGHFDPAVFQAFVRSLGIYPTGALVRLKSQNLAIVAEQNTSALTAPVVKVFFSLRSQMHVPPRRLDLSRPGCADRIVGREPAEAWAKLDLDSLWAGGTTTRA